MKNYEKYAEEGKRWDKGRNFCDEFIEPTVLKLFDKKCEFTSCELCSTLRMMWLFEDYEEPETDWSKVEVDTPILVRQNEDGDWLRRHFAKYEEGIVYTWKDGRTSWTEDFMTEWDYGKLAESEEE